MSPLTLQRDEAWWPNPLRFEPQRWLGEASAANPPEAYLPFGHGRHNCIGQSFALNELILVVATIAAHWRIRVIQPERGRPRATITLRPRSAVRARLERRV